MFSDLLNRLGLAYWVELRTEQPSCLYYFGPFLSRPAAEGAIAGYTTDLEGEGARCVEVRIVRCRPSVLTLELSAAT
jgi:hypothetical protein